MINQEVVDFWTKQGYKLVVERGTYTTFYCVHKHYSRQYIRLALYFKEDYPDVPYTQYYWEDEQVEEDFVLRMIKLKAFL